MTANSRFAGHLNEYYDRVIGSIRNALKTILIFGPGEAKGELKKRLERAKIEGCISDLETTDKMTNNQIVAKVRDHFRN